MPLHILCADITRLQVDAIVNAANRELRNYAIRRGGGVCGAIFRAAGHEALQAACDRIGGCDTGKAVITEGFALPARYVIHAVGPVYRPGDPPQAALLQSCYHSALALAHRHDLHSIAFPLISSGIYGYPGEEAVRIALDAIRSFLLETDAALDVTLCILDPGLLAYARSLVSRPS